MLSVQVFGPGGHDRNTASEYLDWWAWHTGHCEGATAEKAVPSVSVAPIDPPFFRGRSSGGIIMNTAMARRLAGSKYHTKRRQPIVVIFGPSVLDRYITAFEKSLVG